MIAICWLSRASSRAHVACIDLSRKAPIWTPVWPKVKSRISSRSSRSASAFCNSRKRSALPNSCKPPTAHTFPKGGPIAGWNPRSQFATSWLFTALERMGTVSESNLCCLKYCGRRYIYTKVTCWLTMDPSDKLPNKGDGSRTYRRPPCLPWKCARYAIGPRRLGSETRLRSSDGGTTVPLSHRTVTGTSFRAIVPPNLSLPVCTSLRSHPPHPHRGSRSRRPRAARPDGGRGRPPPLLAL
jgi:hypothetical protein